MKCLLCSTRNAMREAKKHPSNTALQSATLKLCQLRLALDAGLKFPPRCSLTGEDHHNVITEIFDCCKEAKNESR